MRTLSHNEPVRSDSELSHNRTLGFGFLDHVYVMALERELRARGHRVAREVSVDIMYKGEELCTQRLYMIVDERVVVETKST